MARVKIQFPNQNPLFTAEIKVRVSDLNYANHVGNDAVLSMIHEARMMTLNNMGCTELDAGGHGMIMADVMIAYKTETFYGDVLQIAVYSDEISNSSFALLYKITTSRKGKVVTVADAKTGMVCYDYEQRKIVPISDKLKAGLSEHTTV